MITVRGDAVRTQGRAPKGGGKSTRYSTGRPAGGRSVGFLCSVCGGGPPQNAHSCDRRHIASAMVELGSYLWIVPHMRSFYVPPKYSAPLTRGFFLRRATSCVEAAWGRGF